MNAEEIKKIIARELDESKSVSNWHGVSLHECLVNPTKRNYEDSFNQGEVIELWLVLEECPNEKDGYQIVFDEKMHEFGLALPGNELDLFLGYYGSFLEALEGM